MIHGDVLIVHGLQHDKDVSSDLIGESSEQRMMIGTIIQLQEDLKQELDCILTLGGLLVITLDM